MGWINPAVLCMSEVESYCAVDSLVIKTVPSTDLVVKGSGCNQGTAKQGYLMSFFVPDLMQVLSPHSNDSDVVGSIPTASPVIEL